MPDETPKILLIASQMPQQELGLIAQILQSQGYQQKQPSQNAKSSPAINFETADKANSVIIKYYQEIGALRLELQGEVSLKIGAALAQYGQYMPILTPQILGDAYDHSQTDMDRRLYAMLLVLAYPNATEAMAALRQKYFDDAADATKEGLLQGLAFLETPDVGAALESLERAAKDASPNIAKLARKAIDALSDRGLIRESESAFLEKIRDLAETNPNNALEQIERYETQGPAPALRAIHAKVLRLCGKNNDAMALLDSIDISAPDAAEAYCERALLREASGAVRQAMADAQSALACDPHNADAEEILSRLNLVLSQQNISNDDKLAQFNRALEENPDDTNMLCQRAQCLLAIGRGKDALNDLERAKKLSPNDPRLPKLLCEAYLDIHYFASALDQASQALKNHTPGAEIDVLLLKPRVFLAMNDIEKARHAIHEIPMELREEPPIVLCSVIIMEMCGETEKATAFYKTHRDHLGEMFQSLHLMLYRDLPALREALSLPKFPIQTPPSSPLGDEPADPFFKRCAQCGALTMKRRTSCRECGSSEFF